MKHSDSWLRKIGTLLVVGMLVCGLALIVIQLKQNQDIRNQASTTGSISFALQPGSTNLNPGQTFPVDINLNTNNKLISGVTLVGKIEGISKDRVALSVATDQLLTPVSQQIYESNGAVMFKLTEVSKPSLTSVFTTQNTSKRIATLVFTPANSSTIKVQLLADSGSQAVEYSQGWVAMTVPGQQTYTINVSSSSNNNQGDKKGCNSNCATDTECQSNYCYKGQCRAKDMPENDKCGNPDAGLHRGCNEYCADTRECDTKFTCYYNKCRLPVNVTNQNCALPPKPTPIVYAGGTGSAGSKGEIIPVPSVKPKTVQATIEIDKPTASSLSSQFTSPSLSPRPSIMMSPSPAAQPSIVPLPENLRPENQQKKKSGVGTFFLYLLGGIGVIGLIGFAYYYWQNK